MALSGDVGEADSDAAESVEEQIVMALRQAEGGTPVREISLKLQVT